LHLFAVCSSTVTDYDYPILKIAGFHRCHGDTVVGGNAYGYHGFNALSPKSGVKPGRAKGSLGRLIDNKLA
jgi:hypothetical protein